MDARIFEPSFTNRYVSSVTREYAFIRRETKEICVSSDRKFLTHFKQKGFVGSRSPALPVCIQVQSIQDLLQMKITLWKLLMYGSSKYIYLSLKAHYLSWQHITYYITWFNHILHPKIVATRSGRHSLQVFKIKDQVLSKLARYR